MKIVVQVRLYPEPSQAAALEATLKACNAAANHAATVLHLRKTRTAYDLQRLVYRDLKTRYGLSAQPAVRVIKKVYDAHKTLQSQLRSGRLGPPGSPRRTRTEGKPLKFQPMAAQPYDDRCLSWNHDTQTVSIWTTKGRIKAIPFKGSNAQLARLRDRRGESDLVYRDGQWFLYATCDIEEPPTITPEGFIGVDLGIVNIAYTSNGQAWSGGAVTFRRKKNAYLRRKLQSKQTKSATRLLKKRARKEHRFVTDINHKISHRIVAEAKRTGHGIAVEDLDGIRGRARLRKPQRATLHTWAFHQLGQHLEYKAKMAGVPFVKVNPAYTSQTCHDCGHRDKANRNRETFACRRCGTISHADHNAAKNISTLAMHMFLAAGQKSTVHSARPAA